MNEGNMDHKQFWTKVRDAAYEGQNGSIQYALDRLHLIHETAILALQKLDANQNAITGTPSREPVGKYEIR